MTTAQQYPVVSYLIDQFGAWVQQRRQLNELSGLDHGEFTRMAHELGLAPGDLTDLVRRGVDGAEELPQMLRALGFTEEAITRIAPPQMMEMRHACAGCTHKQACHVDLAAKTAAAHYEDYCANANELTLMRTKRDRAANYSPTLAELFKRPA
ncbi:DUF6455 family protein [Tardiphaga alba]|uniref:DUF6455 family protein n=1 Tax=Tardiphaga alba TaxID=340268 RepID=UPI001BAA017D|nr:DUF6455 family protein [Tardiphaga alba]